MGPSVHEVSGLVVSQFAPRSGVYYGVEFTSSWAKIWLGSMYRFATLFYFSGEDFKLSRRKFGGTLAAEMVLRPAPNRGCSMYCFATLFQKRGKFRGEEF